MTVHRMLRTLAIALLSVALLDGCALVGSGQRDAGTIYSIDPRVSADATWPSVRWQLAVATPTASRAIDTLRIAVRPTPNELQVYKGVQWSKRPSEMIEDTVLRALEDSGRTPAVARPGSGIAADYKLVLDLRRFESDYVSGAPAATVEVSAKLLHTADQQVVASRTLLQAVPAEGVAVPAVVAAFEQALARTGRELAVWALVSGEAHERAAHR